jgi:hypothetical protein
MKVEITRKKTEFVDVRYLSISAKCSDLCCSELLDGNHNTIWEHDGYVPNIKNGIGGNYIDIVIDLMTGLIVDWVIPDAKTIKEIIEGDKFKVVIEEGYDEFWEDIIDRKVTGCDEVLIEVTKSLNQNGWACKDDSIILVKYESDHDD